MNELDDDLQKALDDLWRAAFEHGKACQRAEDSLRRTIEASTKLQDEPVIAYASPMTLAEIAGAGL